MAQPDTAPARAAGIRRLKPLHQDQVIPLFAVIDWSCGSFSREQVATFSSELLETTVRFAESSTEASLFRVPGKALAVSRMD